MAEEKSQSHSFLGPNHTVVVGTETRANDKNTPVIFLNPPLPSNAVFFIFIFFYSLFPGYLYLWKTRPSSSSQAGLVGRVITKLIKLMGQPQKLF